MSKLLFHDLSFTDDLIKEHLTKLQKNLAKPVKKGPNFVPRDPTSFRKFMTRPQNEIIAPYEHFYMREALKKGNPEGLYAQIKQLEQDPEMNKDEIEDKYRQIEDLVMNYKKINEDYLNLNRATDNLVEVNFDLSQFSAMQQKQHQHEMISDKDLDDEAFLHRQRCVAETNFIKASISYKIWKNAALTPDEQAYLTEWNQRANDISSVSPMANVMVPSTPSALKISSLEPNDIYALNCIPRVSLS